MSATIKDAVIETSSDGRAKVVSEPRTYRPDAPFSYFKDMIDAFRGDNAATERQRRHGREIRDELSRRDELARSAKPGDLEYRVNPSRTSGQGGSFAPPLWLIDLFATAPRAKRVLADLTPQFPLPQGVQSVNIPRLTTGTSTQSEADGAAESSTDIVDTSVTCEVVTIAGHGDTSMQLLDQSPPGAHLDWAFFKDLSEAYDAQLEYQMINGSASANQLPGLLSVVPSSNQITYTSGSPTGTGLFPPAAQAVAAIGNNRKLPPECWLMTTSRAVWIAAQPDTSGRPLGLANRDGAGKYDLVTYPVEPDDAIPTTLGSASNQDALIAVRPSDGVLLESAPRAAVFTEVLSGTLQARIQLHRYVAYLFRYPSAVATVRGTGMVVQSGY